MNDTNPDYAPSVARDLFTAITGMYVSKAVWESKTTSPRLDTKDLGCEVWILIDEPNIEKSKEFYGYGTPHVPSGQCRTIHEVTNPTGKTYPGLLSAPTILRIFLLRYDIEHAFCLRVFDPVCSRFVYSAACRFLFVCLLVSLILCLFVFIVLICFVF